MHMYICLFGACVCMYLAFPSVALGLLVGLTLHKWCGTHDCWQISTSFANRFDFASLVHGSLNVPIEHHPTIRYMVYNGYYKVMSCDVQYTQNGTVTNPCKRKPPCPQSARLLWHGNTHFFQLGPMALLQPALDIDQVQRLRPTKACHGQSSFPRSGDGREYHGTFGSWESAKQREQSFWAILYRHIYIYIYIEVVMFLSFEDFFQRPVTTNGGFDVSGQVYDVACISLGPCGHEDGAKPRQYAIQQFSQPFF